MLYSFQDAFTSIFPFNPHRNCVRWVRFIVQVCRLNKKQKQVRLREVQAACLIKLIKLVELGVRSQVFWILHWPSFYCCFFNSTLSFHKMDKRISVCYFLHIWSSKIYLFRSCIWNVVEKNKRKDKKEKRKRKKRGRRMANVYWLLLLAKLSSFCTPYNYSWGIFISFTLILQMNKERGR